MEHVTVGADSIRPNVTEQNRWVNETASNIVPFTERLNCAGLRADSIRPYRTGAKRFLGINYGLHFLQGTYPFAITSSLEPV